jgi:hypothetical protein
MDEDPLGCEARTASLAAAASARVLPVLGRRDGRRVDDAGRSTACARAGRGAVIDRGQGACYTRRRPATQWQRTMSIDLYSEATNAQRVAEVAEEDARRRALSHRALPRRPGVSVLCRVEPGTALDAFIEHLAYERDAFWRRNLELEVVLLPPGAGIDALARAAVRHVGGWVVLGRADGSPLDAVNAAACEVARGDALLLVDAPLAATPGGTPILDTYLQLAAAPTNGIIAPVLADGAGGVIDPGLRVHHGADHRDCAFVADRSGLLARGASDSIEATASPCAMVRWEAFAAAGGLDARLPVDLAKVELCLAANRLGYETRRLHVGSLGTTDVPVDRAPLLVHASPRFARRWRSYLECRFP